MSEKGSDSESNNWTVVCKEDVESSDDGGSSSASSDFVDLESAESVSYHHIQGTDKNKTHDSEDGGSEATPQCSPQSELKFVLRLKDHGMAGEEDDSEQQVDETTENESRDSSVASGDTYTVRSNSCSSIEELAPEETQGAGAEICSSSSSSIEMVQAADAEEAQHVSGSPVGKIERKISHESDSDQSDFVRLDPSMAEESHNDLMRLSGISSASNGSSLSSSFRFIHRSGMVLGAEEYLKRHFYRDNDAESVQSDIDDRCESDISGVADDDMSSYSLGDLPISEGNVVRSYKHRPNNSLNQILTTLALVVLFGAVGIGVGHFMGTRSEARLRGQQVEKMKTLTDDYLMCLQHQEMLEEKLANGQGGIEQTAKQMKEQYDDIVAELQQQIGILQRNVQEEQEKKRAFRRELFKEGKELAHLSEDIDHFYKPQLQECKTQAESAIAELKNEVNVLRTENDDLKSSVTAMRYNTLPAIQTVQERARTASLRKQVNELAHENSDLKKEVVKLRYTEHPGNPHAEGLKHSQREKVKKKRIKNKNKKIYKGRKKRKKNNFDDKKKFKQARGNGGNKKKKNVVKQRNKRKKQTLYFFNPPVLNGDLAVQREPAVTKYVADSPRIPESSVRLNSKADCAVPEMESEFVARPEQPDASSEEIQSEKMEELEQKLEEAKEKLEVAKARAEMWQSLFQAESERAAKVGGKTPDVVSCLTAMFPEITLDDLTQMTQSTVENVTQFLNKQWQFIQNVTKDESLSETLKGKWSQFQKLFDSPTVKGASEKAKEVYHDIHNIIENKFEEFKEYSGFSKQTKSKEKPETDVPREETSRFDDAINKTKETVQRLTEKINQTWNKVKDIPGKLAERVVPGVTKKVEKFTDKLNSGLKKVQNKVNSGWEKVKNKVQDGWFKKEQSKEENREHRRGHKTHNHKHDSTVDPLKQYHGDPYWNDIDDDFDDTFTQPTDRDNFENKPDHKQKQSKAHAEKRYAEFWDAVGFDPDDIFHEGFFEGNDRNWRKHQTTLRKLHGRIQKLNEDILHDMDDDDIEDLYDDLEDFEDDFDPDIQPTTLKTWLSCQIRWWKSRFQRKHRDEDLIQGCGRQLMHWQMKSSCSAKCKGKKSCKNIARKSPVCQHFLSQSVIQTVAKPNAKTNQNRKKNSFESENGKSREDNRFEVDSRIRAYEIINFTAITDDENHEEMISNKPAEDEKPRKHEERDPEWLYERARDLEYRMHKTDWVYRRAHDRDFHRRRPSDWYHERVEAREHKHHALRGRQ